MSLDYTIRQLEVSDAHRYYEMTVTAGWNDTEELLSDLIQAHQYKGYVWGAFLPDGKLICMYKQQLG